METKTDILNELKSLSPLIARMEKVNVFTIPQGYFDSISTTVLACLKEEHHIFNLRDNKQLPAVPEGYFDQLADAILDKIKAGETARDEIANLSPLLYDLQNKNVSDIPAGYFESLHTVIIDKIKTAGAKEELKELSPLLYGIQSKAIFEIPDGYFDGFPGKILKKVTSKTAKVVVMRKQSILIKYAVAAMLTGVTAVGIYKYVDKPGAGAPVETSNNIAIADAPVEKGKNMNDQQFNEALENLNNADIAKYLENNVDIADVAVLNNNVDQSKLPSQDDYLLDEATLENYLKEIEKTTINN